MTERNYREEARKIPNKPFRTDYDLFEDMLDEIDRLRKILAKQKVLK